MTEKHTRSRFALPALTVFAIAAVATSHAQQPQPKQPNFQVPGGFGASQGLSLPPMPTTTAITPNGTVVEDVIARVNDRIITRTEYLKSQQSMLQEAQQSKATEADLEEHLHNLLRDMIDQQLLIAKGKQLGISCDADVMRRLDQIRKENHLNTMEDLERAASQQGVSFEDFKESIKNQCITSQVVREDVGRHVNMTHAEELAYYNAHQADFTQPEQVHLSEILIPTPDSPTDAQIAQAKAKAEEVAGKINGGMSFADAAKQYSGGPTASSGGDLGDFKRGALGDVLENATFALNTGQMTAPIRTRQGYVLLRVDSHQQAGTPPLDKVEPQVQEALYMEELQPALRAYLTKARHEAYVEIKAGFVDSGSDQKKGSMGFTAYAPPPVKKKIVKHQAEEQERAAKAATALAEAREKAQEKKAEKAAADAKKAGVKDVSYTKPKKIRKEKIRYGQAPRNALPAASSAELARSANAPTGANTPIAGQAPGAALAPNTASTQMTNGTGPEAGTEENALAAQDQPEEKKTRFSTREAAFEEKSAEKKLNKAESKATLRPTPATPQQSADEKMQSATHGLNGDTVKKQKKQKAPKGTPKERMQDQTTKPADTTQPVAPTVNPTLGQQATPPATTTPPDSTPKL